MALVGINPVSSEPRKPSTLENVALAFQIANNAVGAGVAIPKLITEMGIAKEQKKALKYESSEKFNKGYAPSEAGKPGAVEVVDPLTEKKGFYTRKEDVSDYLEKIKVKNLEEDNTPLTDEEMTSLRLMPQYRNVPDSLLPKTRGDYKDDQGKIIMSSGDLRAETEGAERARMRREEFSRRESNDKSNFLERQSRAFEADPAVKKAVGNREAADGILAIADMAQDNPIAANSIPTFMAKASGEVGNLSEADKKPFGGSLALDSRIKQAWSQWQKGTMTPENQAFVKQLAVTLRNHAESTRAKRAQEFIKARRSMRKDVTEQELSDALLGGVVPEQLPSLTEGDTEF